MGRRDRTRELQASRRTVLTAVVVGGVGGLAGCLGSDGGASGPDPIALDDGQQCDNCDMRIDAQPGPVGQAFYGEEPPSSLPEDREDGVAWFCSSTCTYTFLHDAADEGHDPEVSYGTDYSTVEYELEEADGATVVSAHLEADAFARLADLTFVVASDVEGAMGRSMIGFGDAEDARAFADEHGGELFEHDEITAEVVSEVAM